ncbi:MAG: DUF3606 domain-containing protein [Vitreoscilla sp.]
MPDPANPATTPANQHIDVRDPAQLERWSKSLGVTPEQLRDVVAAAGDQVEAVRQHIQSGHGEAG